MKPIMKYETILSTLSERFPSIHSVEPVSEGEESHAFAFQNGGEPFICRVNHSAASFEKDRYCWRQFGSDALPIPEIISIHHSEGYAICVSRRARGCTLQDLPASALPAIVKAVSATMVTMAQAPLSDAAGFGCFDASGKGQHPTWADHIGSIADPHRYDWHALRNLVPRRWVEQHMRLILDWIPHCPEVRALVHGDFGSNNVLTDGAVITGVIDWSEAMFGDPRYDIANIFFWRPWLACMEAQASHFERRPLWMAANASALTCYQVRIGLQQVYETALQGDEQDMHWAMARCDAIAGG